MLLSSSTFQVVKCAQVTVTMGPRGATIIPLAPKGMARCLFGCCGLDSLSRSGRGCPRCLCPPPQGRTDPADDSAMAAISTTWYPKASLGLLRVEQAWASEGGFLARVTTRLFCPALS